MSRLLLRVGTTNPVAGQIAVFNAAGRIVASSMVETAQAADVASAGTLNLDTATGNVVDVTGTTTVTAITLSQGRFRIVRFTGALTLTNGASLVLPGGANIVTAAGDFAIFVGYASNVVRCAGYFRTQVPQETGTITLTATGMTTSPTGDARYVRNGRQVTMHLPGIAGTSNAVTFTYTGIPAALRPTTATGLVMCVIQNNGVDAFGHFQVETNGTVTFTPSATAASNAWTNSGAKRAYVPVITYYID